MTEGDWRVRTEELGEGRGYRVAIDQEGVEVSRGDVIAYWQDEPTFREFFNNILSGTPLDAFRWETPPVTRETLDRPFECVLLDAPELKRPADPADFAEHFRDAASGGVIEFTNLGGDAHLLVPVPDTDTDTYAHIGAFVRRASAAQRDELWRRLGEALAAGIGTQPLWPNTAGTGVPWLHLRLDTRPKYYLYRPYRSAP